jgi:hypothetical protein
VPILYKTAFRFWRLALKKFLLFFFSLAFLLPISAQSQDQSQDQPQWSFELKGGYFTPSLANWKEFYGKRSMPDYGFSLAYKLRRQIEVGVETSYIHGTGQAYAPIHETLAGTVNYSLVPVNAFILFRGVVNENQWVVPYVGGGFTEMYYQEKIVAQSSARGLVDGYHYRGGLQFLLDAIDPDSAKDFNLEEGVYHTYLFIEAERTSAIVKSASVNIGGTAYLMGLLFEF